MAIATYRISHLYHRTTTIHIVKKQYNKFLVQLNKNLQLFFWGNFLKYIKFCKPPKTSHINGFYKPQVIFATQKAIFLKVYTLYIHNRYDRKIRINYGDRNC